MRFILSLANITVKGGRTERLFYFLQAVALLLLAVTPYFATMSPRQGKQVALDFVMATQAFVGIMMAVFIGSGLLSKDIDKKIIYTLISQPVTRAQYVLGRFLGMAYILLIIVSITTIFGMVSYFATLEFFPTLGDSPRWDIYVLNSLFLFLKLLILVSVAFFFSSFSTSSLFPLALTIGVYLAGTSALKVRMYFEASDISWGAGYKILVDSAFYLLPNLTAFDLKSQAAYGLAVHGPSLLFTALYGVLYTVVVLTLTVVIFSKRDLV